MLGEGGARSMKRMVILLYIFIGRWWLEPSGAAPF